MVEIVIAEHRYEQVVYSDLQCSSSKKIYMHACLILVRNARCKMPGMAWVRTRMRMDLICRTRLEMETESY